MKKLIFASICVALACFTAFALAKNSLVTTYLLGINTAVESENLKDADQVSTNNLENLSSEPAIANQTTIVSKDQLPDHIFFDMILNTVLSMDKAAAKLEAEGKSGKIWKKFFEREGSLTESEVAILRKIAADFEQEVTPIQSRALQIITERRAARTAGQRLPRLPDEIKSLQSRRDAVSLRYGIRLQNELGVELIKKLRILLEKNTHGSEKLSDTERLELHNQIQHFRTQQNSLPQNQSEGGKTNE